MSRYTKAGSPSTISAIDSELENIETAIADSLSRKGDSPNQMEASLDMNSNSIVNLPAPTGLTEPLRLGDAGLVSASFADVAIQLREEYQALAEGQVVVNFNLTDSVLNNSFFARSPDGSTSVRLIEGLDYNYRTDISDQSIELTRTWDAGTYLQRIYNDAIGTVDSQYNYDALRQYDDTTELATINDLAVGERVGVMSTGAFYILRASSYTALDGDVTNAASQVWELQPENGSRWNVTWFGAYDDQTDTVDQSSFFEAAATRVQDNGTVVVPAGRYKLDSATSVATQWELAPEAEIIGLGGVSPTFSTDTTRLTGSMIRLQRSEKGSQMYVGETDYAHQKARGRGAASTITATSASGDGALYGGSNASKDDTLNQSCIGVSGVVVNDNTSVARTAWAMYAEAIQDTAAAGNTFSQEIAIISKNAPVQVTPNTPPAYGAGITAGIWVSAGIAEGDDTNVSLWAASVPNAESFEKGWVTYNGSIVDNGTYKETCSWENKSGIAIYPTDGIANDTTPCVVAYGRDYSGSGDGRFVVNAVDVNGAGDTSYFFESGQFSPTDNVSNLGTPTPLARKTVLTV